MARQKTSPLDKASDRLSEAFSRLEKAAMLRPKGGMNVEDVNAINENWGRHCEALESDIHSLRSENEALREENTHLSNQLQQAQQDYLELRQRMDSVAGKLDKKAKQLELLA